MIIDTFIGGMIQYLNLLGLGSRMILTYKVRTAYKVDEIVIVPS